MKLHNRTKTAKTYNIPCRPGCTGAECLCQLVTTQLHVELDDGTKGIKEVERRLPGSVTILAGEKSSSLPSWVGESKYVKAALARREVVLVQE